MNSIPKRITKDITAFAEKHGIQKVILFGSRARGTHTERSDIDIAVSGGDFDAFYWDVKENTHSPLTFKDIKNYAIFDAFSSLKALSVDPIFPMNRYVIFTFCL